MNSVGKERKKLKRDVDVAVEEKMEWRRRAYEAGLYTRLNARWQGGETGNDTYHSLSTNIPQMKSPLVPASMGVERQARAAAKAKLPAPTTPRTGMSAQPPLNNSSEDDEPNIYHSSWSWHAS